MEKIKIKRGKINKKILLIIVTITIFALGIFFRFWQLETIPPGLQYDEAYNGIDALKANETKNYRLFYAENNGREGLYINFISLFLDIFGVNNFGIRFASALFGSLTLVGFFFLIRELRLSWLSVIMGTYMLAFSFWHLNFSRIVYRGIMAPMLLVWIFFFFYRGLRTRKYRHFVISGLLTGLGFHTYISFRIVPLIFVVLVFFLVLLNSKFFKNYWKSAALFIFCATISATPLFIYFYHHPSDFTGRTGEVSIFNAPDMSFPQALSKSVVYHLGAFLVYGDPNQRHNHDAQPLLPAAWAVLFVFGLLISFKEIILTIIGKFKKIRSRRLCHASILGQSIFWIMLIPGIMSIEGIPHSLRIIGAVPGVFLITIVPFEYLLKIFNNLKSSRLLSLKPWRWVVLKISFAGLIVTIIIAGIFQVYLYFGVWAKDPKTAESLERELYDLGKTIKELPACENNILIVSQEVGIFNDHHESSLKTTEFAGYPKTRNLLFYHPFEGIAKIPCENSLIIFQKSDLWLRNRYREKCPELDFIQYLPENGSHLFWVLK